MCGRYTIGTEIENIRFREIMDEVNSELADINMFRIRENGDIFPGDTAPVICTISSNMKFEGMKWGFRHDGGLVINARSESAAVKPMFRKSVECMRCAVPATGFYEWNARKEKFIYTASESNLLMLAGLYRVNEDGKKEYTILTRDAYGSYSDIHGRIPLILSDWKSWLTRPAMTNAILASGGDVNLRTECLSPRQLSMF